MLKAIIKKEVCEKLHPIYKVKSGVAYRVIQLDDTMTVRQKKCIRVMTPGGRGLVFYEGEYELVEPAKGKENDIV